MVSGFKTPEIVAFSALMVLWNAGVIDESEAVSGFTNSGVLSVGVLFVVIQAVERSQIAGRMARWGDCSVVFLSAHSLSNLTSLNAKQSCGASLCAEPLFLLVLV